jgi:hypothetical protein
LGSQVERACLAALLQAYGGQVESRTDWTTAQLRSQLKQQIPIVVATRFTPMRHLIAIVGHGRGSWRVLDPWGDATTGYRCRNGDRVDYPADYFAAMVGAEGAIVGDAIRGLQ